MQGDPQRYDNYLRSVDWLENAKKWERNLSTLRTRVIDGRDPRTQATFNKIVECHRRWHAALATATAYASV